MLLGLVSASQMFDGTTIPSFAKWRWGTIYEVCAAISVLLATLANVWPLLTFIHKLRDNTLIKNVSAALTNKDWVEHQFFFVEWYSSWLIKLQRWGMGCECHRSQLEAGEKVECFMKSRLMRTAYDHLCKHLDVGVKEVIRDPILMGFCLMRLGCELLM